MASKTFSDPALPTLPRLAAGETAHLTVSQRLVADGARMHVQVFGDIDLTTAPALADALELAHSAAMTVPELVEIEVDLRAVGFLSAAGLAELVRAHHCCDDNAVALYVVADHLAVTRPLRLTGLDESLGLRALSGTASVR